MSVQHQSFTTVDRVKLLSHCLNTIERIEMKRAEEDNEEIESWRECLEYGFWRRLLRMKRRSLTKEQIKKHIRYHYYWMPSYYAWATLETAQKLATLCKNSTDEFVNLTSEDASLIY